MNSMTGFGRSTFEFGNIQGTFEVTSVNRKTLDIVHSAPREWMGLDSFLSSALKSYVNRGRISVSIRCKSLDNSGGFDWSENSVLDNLKRFEALANEQGMLFQPDQNFLLQLAIAQKSSQDLPDWRSGESEMRSALLSSANELKAMREIEGAALKKDLESRIQRMTHLRNFVETEAGDMVESYRLRLYERLKISGLELDLDDERVLKEIAIFSDRCDISEELIRLASHYKQFLETIEKTGPIGRKLEFIAQEIGRELNTIGSKSNSLNISKTIIECKNELESVREQVLNVE